MKKQQPKILVLQEMTRRDIEGIGQQRYVGKYLWRYTIAMIAVASVGMWVGGGELNGVAGGKTCGVLGLLVLILGLRTLNAGKKLWLSVKDKEQPVKI